MKNNDSTFGRLCAKGGLGGGGGRVSSVGRNGTTNRVISSFSCHLSEVDVNSFDEAAFLSSLKIDLEREILDSGATIHSQGNTSPSGFFIEYDERDIHGRITLEGKNGGWVYYSLSANIDEGPTNASQPPTT